MAGINTTVIPNLSIDSLDKSGHSIPALNVASTASFTCAGIAAFTGAESHTGAATFTGGIGLNSALTLGLAGVPFKAFRKSTVSVALGTDNFDSVTTAITENNVSAGDIIIAIKPASIWSGAYYDINLYAYASAASTITLVANNSTNTAFNTDAMNMDIYWLDLA